MKTKRIIPVLVAFVLSSTGAICVAATETAPASQPSHLHAHDMPGMSMPPASAPATAPVVNKSQITVETITEEGQRLIHAIVKVDGKPVENVTVQFYVARTFGWLLLGEDKALDDGSAAVKFPVGLPGDADGSLHVIAEVKEPPQYVGCGEAVLAGGVPPAAREDPFPRALWSRHAPVWLLATIATLLAGVWSTYAFVISQVLAIHRGAKS